MNSLALGLGFVLVLPFSALPESATVDGRSRLDKAIEDKWKQLGISPEAPADDATMLRRLWLDLAGRVPPAVRAREYLENRDEGKRTRLIETLLDSPEFAEHWGRSWAERLTGRRPIKQEKYDARVLQSFLGTSFAARKPYAQLVREILTGEGMSDASGPANFLLRYEAKPIDLAGAVSKQFLGVTLQCAQCHDHPFARWKQDDFWGIAAFFGRTRMLEANDENGNYLTAILEARRGELMIPDAKAKPDDQGNTPMKKVLPRLPESTAVSSLTNRRRTLADWITADTNPYFARHGVNRVWGQLFGTPLVKNLERETADEEGQHSEVLRLLTDEFKKNGQDIKGLIRTIVTSRAYQLSAGSSPPTSATDVVAEHRLRQIRNLARFPIRPLSVDQLHASITQATGYEGNDEAGVPNVPPTDEDDDDDMPDMGDVPVTLLGERALTVQRSLAMLQSEYVEKAVQAGTRAAIAANGNRSDATLVDWLFHALLARRPNVEETRTMLQLLKEGKGQRGIQDGFWVLLNTVEFSTNH